MSTFRLKESLLYAKENGLTKSKKEIARIIWPESGEVCARVNMSNLESGRCKRIETKNVAVLCGILGVSADYLFGLTNNPCPVSSASMAVPGILDSAVKDLNAISERLDTVSKLLK